MENESSSINRSALLTDNVHESNSFSPIHLSHATQEPILIYFCHEKGTSSVYLN